MVNIEKMLRFEEGERLDAYYCSMGVLTIGIGHNLETDPAMDILNRKIKYKDKITQAESSVLFDRDLKRVRTNLIEKIDDFEQLEEKYQAVLISMCFQLGIGGLLAFKNMLMAMRANNPDRVEVAMKNSKWYRQTTNRVKRLISVVHNQIPEEYL